MKLIEPIKGFKERLATVGSVHSFTPLDGKNK